MRPHRLLSCGLAALVTTGLLGIAAVQRARAGASELVQSVGEPLLAYARARRDGGLHTLVVNGARLRMRTGTTRDTIDEVLDTQGAHCGGEPNVRKRSASQGFVACFHPPQGTGLIGRLQAFAANGDLSALGELRVTWVMQEGNDKRYVVVASDGPIDVLHMFPAQGDAPGNDVPGVPRPPEARRMLSTWQSGDKPMLVSYRSELGIAQLEPAYRADLIDRGLELERSGTFEGDQRALVVRRGKQLYLALIVPDGAGTLISIVSLATGATEARAAR